MLHASLSPNAAGSMSARTRPALMSLASSGVTPEVFELVEALDHERAGAVKKLNGLSDDDARRSTVASGTNLAGLLQHLTFVESKWFGQVLHNGHVRNRRWVILGVIQETARHAGHADIIREQIDGKTGR